MAANPQGTRPDIRTVLILMAANNAGNLGLAQAIEAAGPALGVQVERAAISSRGDLGREFERFAETRYDTIIALSAIFLSKTSI